MSDAAFLKSLGLSADNLAYGLGSPQPHLTTASPSKVPQNDSNTSLSYHDALQERHEADNLRAAQRYSDAAPKYLRIARYTVHKTQTKEEAEVLDELRVQAYSSYARNMLQVIGGEGVTADGRPFPMMFNSEEEFMELAFDILMTVEDALREACAIQSEENSLLLFAQCLTQLANFEGPGNYFYRGTPFDDTIRTAKMKEAHLCYKRVLDVFPKFKKRSEAQNGLNEAVAFLWNQGIDKWTPEYV